MRRIAVIIAVIAAAGGVFYARRVVTQLDGRWRTEPGTRASVAPVVPPADIPYDVSGKTAVVTAFHSPDPSAPATEMPILWLRGNLVLIDKPDDAVESLNYRRTLVDRPAMDDFVRKLAALPADLPGRIRVVVYPVGAPEIVRRITDDAFKSLVGELAEKKPRSACVLDALRVSAQKAAAAADALPWPFPTLALDQVAAKGEIVSIDLDTNRMIQARIKSESVYRFGKECYRVTLRPRIDARQNP